MLFQRCPDAYEGQVEVHLLSAQDGLYGAYAQGRKARYIQGGERRIAYGRIIQFVSACRSACDIQGCVIMTGNPVDDILDFVRHAKECYGQEILSMGVPKEYYDQLSQEDLDRIEKERGVRVVPRKVYREPKKVRIEINKPTVKDFGMKLLSRRKSKRR